MTLVETLPRLGMSQAEAATPVAPTLTGPLAAVLDLAAWINSPPLAAADLQGKTVVVNFWTYSCINCLRTLPSLRTWAARYKDQGLVVIGVHAPEFGFERDFANVSRAAATLGVQYPVVLDNDFRIWRAFGNDGWPAIYVVDPSGRIRSEATGEGEEARTEAAIQHLLAEANGARAAASVPMASADGTQHPADWADLRSPETYIGNDKAERFAPPGTPLGLNQWSLTGDWAVGGEYATASRSGAGIRYRFHARDLHLVLLPSADGHPVRFRVTLDGAVPGADHGADTDAQGYGTVTDGRLYQLARQAGPVADRTLDIEFLDPGARAYAFTFG